MLKAVSAHAPLMDTIWWLFRIELYLEPRTLESHPQALFQLRLMVSNAQQAGHEHNNWKQSAAAAAAAARSCHNYYPSNPSAFGPIVAGVAMTNRPLLRNVGWGCPRCMLGVPCLVSLKPGRIGHHWVIVTARTVRGRAA